MTPAVEPLISTQDSRELFHMTIAKPAHMLIDRAAAITGKTRTDFIPEAAQQEDDTALHGESPHLVAPDIYAAFLAMLDVPACENEALRHAMHAPIPWG